MSDDYTAVERSHNDHKLFSRNKLRGKIFSRLESAQAIKEEKAAKKQQRQSQLDDDVNDFLRPSSARSQQIPFRSSPQKIDRSTAQRWPGAAVAQDARGLVLVSCVKGHSNRSRTALTVGFAKAVPEVIGVGGDEAEEPPIEVSKTRSRSRLKEHLEGWQGSKDDAGLGLSSPDLGKTMAQTSAFNENARPSLVQRSQTSIGELSQPVQLKVNQDPSYGFPQYGTPDLGTRPGFGPRKPTGYDSPDPDKHAPDQAAEFTKPAMKRVQTGFSPPIGNEEPTPRLPELNLSEFDSPSDVGSIRSHFLKSEPLDPESFSAHLINKMRAEEGKALHEGFKHPATLMLENASRPSSSGSMALAPAPLQVRPSPAPLANAATMHAAAQQEPAQPSLRIRRDPSPNVRPGSSGRPISSGSTDMAPSLPQSRAMPPSAKPIPSPGAAPRALYSYSGDDSSLPKASPQPPSIQTSSQGSPSYFEPIPLSNSSAYHSPASRRDLERSPPPKSRLSPMESPNRNRAASPTGDTLLEDFGGRVAHMKGVFRLTAERERSHTPASPLQWLRAAVWWFLQGRTSLEASLKTMPRGPDGRPVQRLTQQHVDLAKTWWIITDVLPDMSLIDRYSAEEEALRPQRAREAGDYIMAEVLEGLPVALANLKVLISSLSRNHVMPPHQSLIQGQDTTIFIKYPNFPPDIKHLLSTPPSRVSSPMDPFGTSQDSGMNPVAYMPPADNRNDFSYGRFFVNVSLSTDDTATDRIALPCVLSIMRGRSDWQVKACICSQGELITLCIQSDNKAGPTWNDVQWKSRSRGMYVRLPRGFTLNVEFSEVDYRTLYNIWEYTKKVEQTLHPEEDETLVKEVFLKEIQYSDTSNPHAFPAERVKRGIARIFEKSLLRNDGSGLRRYHRGYRLLIITSPRNKALASVSHHFGRGKPMEYEFMDLDDLAPGLAINIREDRKKCRIILGFEGKDAQIERADFYKTLNGMEVAPDEEVTLHCKFKGLSIESIKQVEGFPQPARDVLKDLKWSDLMVVNREPDTPATERSRTVLSESLKIVATHAGGDITDRINVGPGELNIRLDISGSPEVLVLRGEQLDIAMSIDAAYAAKGIPETLTELLQTIMSSQTIRTFAFQSLPDLHAFQTAITGFEVRFDGIATTFAISRRRMVVPIYKRWSSANPIRLQIVKQPQTTAVQLLAFFEEFSHADAMNFVLKSTDVFEREQKGGKWYVKLVDAKFALPKELGKAEEADVGRRFVCLDLPEYPGEHDDINIGFESEDVANQFVNALPATPQLGRAITFKRKI